MTLLSRLKSWLRAILRRNQMERDMHTELLNHIRAYTEDLMKAGVTAEEAARRARIEFGSIDVQKEACRQSLGLRFWDELRADTRFGFRMLRKTPGLTAIVLLSLALGIGANTAIFSVVDALMWRKLPVHHPEQIVSFRLADNMWSSSPWSSILSYPLADRLRGLDTVFSQVSAVALLDRYNVIISGSGSSPDSPLVRVALVSGSYFSLFQVNPAYGRLLGPNDDRTAGAHPVAVISYDCWSRWFALRSDVLDRTLALNGTTYSIVGVAPRGFAGDWVGRPACMDLRADAITGDDGNAGPAEPQ